MHNAHTLPPPDSFRDHCVYIQMTERLASAQLAYLCIVHLPHCSTTGCHLLATELHHTLNAAYTRTLPCVLDSDHGL